MKLYFGEHNPPSSHDFIVPPLFKAFQFDRH